MLSSDHKRFQWAKADRVEDTTIFRQMIQKWHPVVRRQTPPLAGSDPTPTRPPKPIWTPWLWVK